MTPALLLLLAAGAASSGSDVFARVDDVVITRADLDERLRVLGVKAKKPEQALNDLVDEALLAADARRAGLDRNPAVVEAIEAQRRRLATDAYLANLATAYTPADDELRRMYHSSGDQLRLVLGKYATEEDARAVYDRVKAGGDLAAEARRSVDSRLAAQGGDTGLVSQVLLDPELAEAAMRAPVGSLVGPVKLSLGWAVARVVERVIADDAGFAERRAALLAMARSRMADQARAHAVERLRKSAGVVLDEKFLESLGSRIDVTQAELDHVIATVNGKPVPYRAVHEQAVAVLRVIRGHGGGARTRIEAARNEIDARLLGDEAVSRGFDRAPSVAAVLPAIERNILAAARAAALSNSPQLGDPAVQARLDGLRRQAKVKVDRSLVASYRP
jgi:hypothetical protein